MMSMGIEDSVESLLADMDVKGLYTMDHPTYVEPTIQFLSSLKRITPKTERTTRQILSFKLMEETHEFTIKDLCRALDFGVGKYESYKRFNTYNFRKSLAFGSLDDKDVAIFRIRNPSIRYTVHLLSNTMFAREDNQNIRKGELRILYRALGSFIDDTHSYGALVDNRSVFINTLFKLKTKLEDESLPLLSFGGLLTPLFIYLGIDLSEFTKISTRRKMDVKYLSDIESVEWIDQKHIFHKFYRYCFTMEKRLLPAKNLTKSSPKKRSCSTFQTMNLNSGPPHLPKTEPGPPSYVA